MRVPVGQPVGSACRRCGQCSGRSQPGTRITARVSRTSGALDPCTRTLFVKIDVANAKDFFVGGSFAYVTSHLAVPTEPLIPVNALVLRDNNQYAVVPDERNVAHFRPAQLQN
jgi:membrane fusion protein, multidrug efflux system